MSTECFVCELDLDQPMIRISSGAHRVNCKRCGQYTITDEFKTDYDLELGKSHNRVKLICAIRTASDSNRPMSVDATWKSVIDNAPGYSEAQLHDQTLLWLSRKGRPGTTIRLQPVLDWPAISAFSEQEFRFFLSTLDAEGLIGINKQARYLDGSLECKVAFAGWTYLRREVITESKTAFVAMWFADDHKPAFTEAIAPAVEATGYIPLRIDQAEHNERINGEILASIKRSKFLVADFTGHRGGVYFEAGLALGFGKQVIWTCKDSHREDIHFDISDFNFIFWKDLPELKRRLESRIKATIL